MCLSMTWAPVATTLLTANTKKLLETSPGPWLAARYWYAFRLILSFHLLPAFRGGLLCCALLRGCFHNKKPASMGKAGRTSIFSIPAFLMLHLLCLLPYLSPYLSNTKTADFATFRAKKNATETHHFLAGLFCSSGADTLFILTFDFGHSIAFRESKSN